MEKAQETALQELAIYVGKINATCFFIAWTIDMITNGNPPETEQQRTELFTGINFIMATIVTQLDDVHRKLNEVNTVR